MKKILILALAIFVTNVTMAQDKGIKFEQGTLAEAVAKAKKSSKKAPKLVFVDCYTTWCGPCKSMSENVFTQEKVGDFFNANFVNIKIDMEKGEGPELGKKFEVKAYPTFLILDGEGKEVSRIVGGGDADGFIAKVKKAMDPANSVGVLKAKYEADKSLANGMQYITALNESYLDSKDVTTEMYFLAVKDNAVTKDIVKMVLGSVESFQDPIIQDLYNNRFERYKTCGTEVVDNAILGVCLNPFFSVISGRDSKIDVKTIEDMNNTLSTLNINENQASAHLGSIALFTIKKDLDGMINYFKKSFVNIVPSREKLIVEGILVDKAKDATEEQKAKIKEYFTAQAEFYKQFADHATQMPEKI